MNKYYPNERLVKSALGKRKDRAVQVVNEVEQPSIKSSSNPL